jgi:hypothetical protein
MSPRFLLSTYNRLNCQPQPEASLYDLRARLEAGIALFRILISYEMNRKRRPS